MDKSELERRLSLTVEREFFPFALKPIICEPPILLTQDGAPRGADIRDCLSLKETSILNLYNYSVADDIFRFEHVENNIISKCEGICQGRKANLKFVEGPFIEDGINYLGKIEVDGKRGGKAIIRLIGERSYDPADSTSCVVTNEQFRFLIGIQIAQIMAAKNGGDRDLILNIHHVAKPYHKIHNRYLLQKYLTFQTVSALYDGVTFETYGQFLLKNLADGQPDLDPNKDIYQINYLEMVAKKEAGEMNGDDILPAQNYLKELLAKNEDKMRTDYNEQTMAILKTLSERFEFSAYIGANYLEKYLTKTMLDKIHSYKGIGMKAIRDRISRLEHSYDQQFRLALKRRGLRSDQITGERNGNCVLF